MLSRLILALGLAATGVVAEEATPVQNSYEWWSMAVAADRLECAVVLERLEPEDGVSLPVDFAAAADLIRKNAALSHGESWVASVTAKKTAVWDAAPLDEADADRLRDILPPCYEFLTRAVPGAGS